MTDPAGKWKKYTIDALGNLIKVTEPNPAGGEVDTTYTYDELDQLTQVTMTRGGVTQIRTYSYQGVGRRLSSVTNPENGLVSYSYNSDGLLILLLHGCTSKPGAAYYTGQAEEIKSSLVATGPTYDDAFGSVRVGTSALLS